MSEKRDAPRTSRPRRLVMSVVSVLAEAYQNWSEHHTLRLGAGLAYYGLFALAPLVSLSLYLAGLFFSTVEVQSFLAERIGATIDADVTAASAWIADSTTSSSAQTGLGIVGLVGILISASFVFVAVEEAIGMIFELEPRSGVGGWIRRRAVSFGIVLITGSVMIAALAVQAVTGLIESIVTGPSPLDEIADLVGTTLSAALGTVVLTVLLRLLTQGSVPWRYALAGSIVTALGLAIGAWGVGVYFSTVGAASLAGAVGGVLAVLIFIYYEAQILLGGAELTNVVWRRGLLQTTDSAK